jgi:hypothetical protein
MFKRFKLSVQMNLWNASNELNRGSGGGRFRLVMERTNFPYTNRKIPWLTRRESAPVGEISAEISVSIQI